MKPQEGPKKRLNVRLLAVLLIVVIVAVAAYVYYAQPPATQITEQSRYGGTLIIAIQDEGTTYGYGLDPTYTTLGFPFQSAIFHELFDGLTIRDFDGTVKPDLATKWEQPDAVTYVFYLRQGVKFHDGTPFNATAVKVSFERTLDGSKPSNLARGRFAGIKSIDIVDNFTVKITLRAPDPFFLEAVASHSGIPSPSAMAKWGAEFGFHPVGSGPFKFVEWTSKDHVTMDAFTDYWAGRPYLDRIVVKVVPDQSVQVVGLEKGEYNLIWTLPDFVSKLKQDKVPIQDGGYSKFNVLSINLNATNSIPQLQDKRVRQAINYAINRKALVDSLEAGYATPAITMVLPTWDWWNPSLKTFPDAGDVAKAKALLSEAGYPNGFEVELLTSTYQGFDKIATIVQQQLAQVGIKATIKSVEFAVEANILIRYQKWQLSIHDVNIASRSRLRDFYHSAALVPNGFNLQSVKDPELDGILNKLLSESDTAKAKTLSDDAQRRILENAYGAPLYYPSKIFAVTPNVKDWKVHPDPWYIYVASLKALGFDAWIDKNVKSSVLSTGLSQIQLTLVQAWALTPAQQEKLPEPFL